MERVKFVSWERYKGPYKTLQSIGRIGLESEKGKKYIIDLSELFPYDQGDGYIQNDDIEYCGIEWEMSSDTLKDCGDIPSSLDKWIDNDTIIIKLRDLVDV